MDNSPFDTESSPAAINMLTSSANPLVAVSQWPRVTIRGSSVHFKRAVGFITERFRGNLRLVTTCRHAFTFDPKILECVLTMKNPRPNRIRIVGQPILDPNPESDIAFVVIRDPQNSPTTLFKVTPDDIPLPAPTLLYNVRNVTDFVKSECGLDATRQLVREQPRWAFVKHNEPFVYHAPFTDEALQEHYLKEGWIRHRSLVMVSRQGYSGSPIWDSELRLYGMNIRGSDPDMEDYASQGDVAICVPTSEIYLARQRADPEIQKVLRSA